MIYFQQCSYAANQKSMRTTALSKKFTNENLVILRSFKFCELKFIEFLAGPNIRKIIGKVDALIHYDAL